MASVLVVKPKTLNAADKKLLREEGIVCVEAADPSSVRLLQLEGPPLSGNDLFYAAIQSIAADKYNGNTAEHFAQTLASLAKATSAT